MKPMQQTDPQLRRAEEQTPTHAPRAAENSARNWRRRRLRRVRRDRLVMAMAERLKTGASASAKRRKKSCKFVGSKRPSHGGLTDDFLLRYKQFLHIFETSLDTHSSATSNPLCAETHVLKKFTVPDWSRLPEWFKLDMIIQAMVRRDPKAVFAFSFNVDPKRLARQKNVATYLHRQIREKAERRLGRQQDSPLDFAFGLHCRKRSAPDELHAHGVALLDTREIELFEDALLAVGGEWRPVGHKGREKQIDVQNYYGRETWRRYTLGQQPRVRRYLLAHGKNPQTFSATHGAIDLGRTLYEAIGSLMRPFSSAEVEWLLGEIENPSADTLAAIQRHETNALSLSDDEIRWLEAELKVE